jgi:uncharacterized delta-60 repeat protein
LEALEDRFLLSGTPLPPGWVSRLPLSIPHQELVLPDGKILIGLSFPKEMLFFPPPSYIPGQPIVVDTYAYGPETAAITIARLNPDGSLDTTFGDNGAIVLDSNMADNFEGFTLQPDGKIVIADLEITSNAFHTVTTTGSSGLPGPLVPQDDILDDSGFSLIRLNADGSTDSTFQSTIIPGYHYDGMGETSFGGVTIQSDGKILLAGESDMGTATAFVARFNTDGSLDTSFDASGAVPGVATMNLVNNPVQSYPYGYGWISAIAIDGEGRILLGGNQSSYGMTVFCFDADGTIDSSFGSGGIASYSPASGVQATLTGLAVQQDGKVVVDGYLTDYPYINPPDPTSGLVVVRFDTDGSVDSSFGNQGVVQIATNTDPLGPYPVQFPDYLSSNPVQTINEPIYGSFSTGVIIDSQGRILIGSEMFAGSGADDVRQGAVIRLNSDGSPDSSFGQDGVQFLTPDSNNPNGISYEFAILPAPDGSIIAIGQPYPTGQGLINAPNPYLTVIDINGSTATGPVGPPPTGGGQPITGPTNPPPTFPPPTFPPPPGLHLPPGKAPGAMSPTNAVAVSNAAFASFVPGGAGSIPDNSIDPFTVASFGLIPPPSTTLLALPLPGTSQSESVARLSGGGDASITSDDPLAFNADPTTIWNLTMASDTESGA